jgi:hypothetical protein
MQRANDRVKCGPELLAFPAAAASSGDGLLVTVRAKKAMWLSVTADRKSGGGVQITIDTDGPQVAAEVAVEEAGMYDGAPKLHAP